jgi:RNA polymerase sigma-70 factor (ECF subfamily)
MTHAAVTDAYVRFGHLVHRRCRRILRDDAAAEDTTQEVFLRLWRYGDAFVVAASKLSWLYRVADRCCFDRFARRSERALLPLEEADEPVSDSSPESALVDSEAALRVLARFDERVQQAIVLRYIDEMTHEEIAQAVGWSRQTVIKKLSQVERLARSEREEAAHA